ncbi:MAG: hypothetical protein AAFW65_01310 [Pseudomonadota bacterium]
MSYLASFRIVFLVTLAFTLAASCGAESVEKPRCEQTVGKRLSLNAFELFEAAEVCALEEKRFQTNLLLLTGQVRAMTDMTVFQPANDDDKDRMGELYGLIYAVYGGLGFDEPYAAKSESDELFRTLLANPIELEASYNPGWSYKSNARMDLYDGVASDQLAVRLWNVQHLAKLLQIPAYFEAHQAMNNITRGQGAIDVNSPVVDEMGRLRAVMSEASEGVEKGPAPIATVAAYEFYFEPTEEDGFRQVASGLNGPEEAQYNLYKSEDDVRTSWVASLLSAEDLGAILADIDFETETLGAMAIGKRSNLSGNIYVTNFDYNSEFGSYSMDIAIGMLPEGCEAEGTEGHPFALSVTSGGEITSSLGRGSNNFPDRCPVP